MQDRDDRHPDELISALFDGELAPEEWSAVKEHLEGCRRCRRLLEEIKTISAAMPADPSVPEGLAARVRERLPTGTGRQRPAPPPRAPTPYKPARRRIGFPLAAGGGLAAALIVGALLIQYAPSSMLSRLRLPSLSAPKDAGGPPDAGAGVASEPPLEEARSAADAAGSVAPFPEAAPEAESFAEAAAEPSAVPGPEPPSEAPPPTREAKAEAAGSPPETAVPPAAADYVAAGERPGLAPGQELPVTVPEEADEPARSPQEIALDAAPPGAVGGVAQPTATNEAQALARDEKGQARRAQEALPPPSAPAAGAAPDRFAEAAPVPSAASVETCRATWGAPRQATWPAAAGRNPERVVGGAGKAAGGRSIVLENPRRVRITVTRARWPELLQRLAAAGVTGTAQLPAPPEWADCASVNVSVPEVPAAPSSPSPQPETPPASPPGT